MPFKKGQSGNAAGKSHAVIRVVELARSKSCEAIEKIYGIMMASEDEKTILTAAEIILDRGIGRPSSTEIDIAQIPDDRLLEEVRRREELHARVAEQPLDEGALHS